VDRRQVDLLALQLELGALDGGFELCRGPVAQLLVYLLRWLLLSRLARGARRLVVLGGRDRSKLERQRQLVVRLGDDLGLLGEQLLLEPECRLEVGYGVGVSIGRERLGGRENESWER